MEEKLEDKLVEEYIGKNADQIIKSKTNWSAAILGQSIGPAWFFYRKSYLLGFLFIIITYIVGRIATAINLNKAYYIMFVIYLFSANQLYIWDVKRKIRKILEKNENMSEEELVNIARKEGGTSTVAAIIYAVVLIIFIFALMVMISYVSSLLY